MRFRTPLPCGFSIRAEKKEDGRERSFLAGRPPHRFETTVPLYWHTRSNGAKKFGFRNDGAPVRGIKVLPVSVGAAGRLVSPAWRYVQHLHSRDT